MLSPLVADVSVRPATPADAEVVTALQLAAWRERLGEEAVSSIDPTAVAASWTAAIASPPDPRGRVLVAAAGPRVVGFVATAPSAASLAAGGPDPADPATPEEAAPDGWTTELVALEVAPADRRQGHGSRLLAAAVDLARERGAHHVGAWSLREDTSRTGFLTSAGLAEVGVRRVLDVPGGEREEFLLTGVIQPEPAAAPRPGQHDHPHPH